MLQNFKTTHLPHLYVQCHLLPNDWSTLLFTQIPRMGCLYLPSALASFFFLAAPIPSLPPWWSSLLSTPAGLPLELLPSLSKAETGSWISLSGTCPLKASLLGEPLGHSKDSRKLKLPSLRVVDLFSSRLYFPSKRIPVQTQHENVETLNSEHSQVTTNCRCLSRDNKFDSTFFYDYFLL